MNTFRFQRELDVPFLQKNYGNDIFSAREIIGSFVEMMERELGIMEAALLQRELKIFARVSKRIKPGLELVGLRNEIKLVNEFRAHLASYGSNDRTISLAKELTDQLLNKRALLKIELQRLDNWLESSANGY